MSFADRSWPDVERAAKLIRDTAKGRVIQRVETKEDTIVFSGVSHDDFVS
jgi:formamidopyrimidine-DNA glycosylase